MVVQDTERLDFIPDPTFFGYNSVVVKVNQNHMLPVMTTGFNNIVVRYNWFRERIPSGKCSVNKEDVKEQKANICTKYLQGETFLHIINLLCVW